MGDGLDSCLLGLSIYLSRWGWVGGGEGASGGGR